MKRKLTLGDLKKIARKIYSGEIQKKEIKISSKSDIVDRTLLRAEQICRKLSSDERTIYIKFKFE